MKKLLAGLAGVCAMALATPANASAVIGAPTVFAVPSNNNFQAQLAGLGLVNYTSTGATLVLDAPAILGFDFLGSESGFNDTFSALGIAPYTETSLFEDHF